QEHRCGAQSGVRGPNKICSGPSRRRNGAPACSPPLKGGWLLRTNSDDWRILARLTPSPPMRKNHRTAVGEPGQQKTESVAGLRQRGGVVEALMSLVSTTDRGQTGFVNR